MVRITEDLVRKRAEHNECELTTLEEVSLHQQDIERIEFLDKWCRELKILYLQSNLIAKIENVGRLKNLEYLNLALNNVEKVENLEGCESLTKLDLTVNFVGELTSIECLKDLCHFEELFLNGNPCAEYEHYREFTIATLPRLQTLDGTPVEKSERIKAIQALPYIKQQIVEQQENYRKKRDKEKEQAKRKEENKPGFDGRWYTDINDGDSDKKQKEKDEEAKEKEFWDEKVAFTPESRIALHKHMQETKNKEQDPKEKEPKKERKLVSDDGRRFNVNEAKLNFTLTDDEENNKLILDLAVYRHLDTSLIDVDVQPNFVKAVMKGKIFQLALDDEVLSDSSTAQRSQVTGHLVVTMPKAKEMIKPQKANDDDKKKEDEALRNNDKSPPNSSFERLEVDPSKASAPDFGNIVKDPEKCSETFGNKRLLQNVPERANSKDFVDDPDVPPLL